MATIPPNFFSLYLVRRIDVDPTAREMSLVGLVTKFSLPGFPATVPTMTAFATGSGGRGEGVLELSVHRLQDAVGGDFPGPWCYRNRKWIKFLNDPNFVTTIEMRVNNLTFSKPGDYLFALSFDDKLITDRRIAVFKSKV
jgi:hypothetical protein